MEAKKEFAIGEETRIQDSVFVCRECRATEDCNDCAFYTLCTNGVSFGYCSGEYRSDGLDVIFKLKEQ